MWESDMSASQDTEKLTRLIKTCRFLAEQLAEGQAVGVFSKSLAGAIEKDLRAAVARAQD
jgi:hypothetical protein